MQNTNDKNANTQWIQCCDRILLDPLNGRPVVTRAFELKNFGGIFEVYDYSGTPETNARLIACAPEMLAMLESVFKHMPEGMENENGLMEAQIAALIAKAKDQ